MSETTSQAILFKTPAKAKDTYHQVLTAIHFGKEAYKPGFSLTVQQTIDSVNVLLQLMNSDKATISLLNDSVFTIRQMLSIRYDINVKQLKSDGDNRFLQVSGIGFVPHIKDGFASGPCITFQHAGGQSVFLKFTSDDTKEQLLVYRLLIYLSNLMLKL
ncbi:MAG: hypothetical protein ACOYVG_00165 [Bacteroidota bacterium]